MIPLNKPSDELVIDLINHDNSSASLPVTKVLFGDPAKNTAEGATKNTTLHIKARKNSGYRDAVDVNYNRLDFAKLFKNVNAFLNVNLPKSTADLIAALNTQYGLSLEASDLVVHTIDGDVNPVLTNPEDPDPAPVEHKLTANEKCLAFIGEVSVWIGAAPQVGERLSLVITKTDLDGLHYPDSDDGTKGQAYIYSYGTDATPVKQFLAGLATGTAIDDSALATEMNKIFVEQWAANDAAADYNTKDASVTYAGPTVNKVPDGNGGTKDEPVAGANTDFANVVKVKLSDTLCSNFTGELYFHYN